MNAYELADDVIHMLERWCEAYPTDIFPEISKEDIEYINAVNTNLSSRFFAHVCRHMIKKGFKPAIDMLRQQADRIAHLEMLLANRNEIIDKLDLTTPQIKELSDEEILNVAFCCEVNTVAIENDWDGTVIDFARAILKKASEK